MSTKTTFKRIALVAVAALGLGVVPAVTSASATTTLVTSITMTSTVAPAAGDNADNIQHTITFKTSTITTGSSTSIEPNVVLSSKPATSVLARNAAIDASGALTSGKWQLSSAARTDATDHSPAVEAQGVEQNSTALTADTLGVQYAGLVNYLQVAYDVAGTYTWTVFNDSTNDGYVSGSDYSTTFTVVVSDLSGATASKATISATNAKSGLSGGNATWGSLVKITLTDAAGNAITPGPAGGVRVTASGSAVVKYVNASYSSALTSSSYTLGSSDFDSSGRAWVNITNATAETVLVSLTGVGALATSFTAPAALTLTFSAATGEATPKTFATAVAVADGGNLATTTAAAASTNGVYTALSTATNALSFLTGNASVTAGAEDIIKVTDTSGKITGKSGARYDLEVSGSATAAAAGLFSISPAWSATGQTATFTVNAGTATHTITATAPTTTTITVDSADYIRAATATKQSFTVSVVDEFGNAKSNVTVTASIAGRNSTVSVASGVTDASGEAVISYTDVSTSTTSLTDTITFTAASGVTDTATVVYTATALLGVDKILLTTPSTKAQGATGAGDPTDTKQFSEIVATVGGATGGAVDVIALVTNSDAVGIQGVPVTFTVAGTGVAIRSDMVTVYTDATGKATSKLYAWTSGDFTVTATYGTKSDDAVSSWRQTDESRTIAAKVEGGIITATVKDRYGNPVSGAAVSASRTGTGFFGSGSTTVAGTLTNSAGNAEFVYVGAGTVTLNLGATTAELSYQQSIDASGKVGTTATTATVAGTATTAEKGVGASLAPAGIHSVSVAVDAPNVAADNAQAATDAAAEATDAANAATDAANAAAEAADAEK